MEEANIKIIVDSKEALEKIKNATKAANELKKALDNLGIVYKKWWEFWK